MSKKLYGGVDLGGTSMIAIIADEKGKILGSSDCETLRGVPPEETLDQIADQLLAAARAAGVKMSKVSAIGLGAPGAVDPDRGIVVKAPNLGWTDVAASKYLRKRLGPRVALGNDVQVAILGEHTYGAARKTKRAIGIWVGTGIGGGLIVDGRLDRGFRGAAGEIGHMMVTQDGPECSCGRRGCVEALASRTAMEREVRAACERGAESLVPGIMSERKKERMTSSVIKRALRADDPVMKEVVSRAQYYLGILAGNLVNCFDPEIIVIGGGVAQRLGDEFVGPIRKMAKERFLRPDTEDRIRIEPAALGDYSGALGASALARIAK
jgi:glucokinase